MNASTVVVPPVAPSDESDCEDCVNAATLNVRRARSLSLLASLAVKTQVRWSVRIPAALSANHHRSAALSASHHRCNRAHDTLGLLGLGSERPRSSPRHTLRTRSSALGTSALSTRPSALADSVLCSVLTPPRPFLGRRNWPSRSILGRGLSAARNGFQMFHGASDMAVFLRVCNTLCFCVSATSTSPRKSTQTRQSRACSHEQIRDRLIG